MKGRMCVRGKRRCDCALRGGRKLTDLWNPRPSMRTTIHVLGSRESFCSKSLTYSYLYSVNREYLTFALRKSPYFEFAMDNAKQ